MNDKTFEKMDKTQEKLMILGTLKRALKVYYWSETISEDERKRVKSMIKETENEFEEVQKKWSELIRKTRQM